MSRLLFGALLAINLSALGFTLGAMAASRLIAPEGEGFSGGALVAVYGSAGCVIGVISGLVLAVKLGTDALLRVTLGAVVLSGISIGLIVLRANR